ncbi:MAG: ribonuclease Y, partial [Candidatus Omnitrophota bacterium]
MINMDNVTTQSVILSVFAMGLFFSGYILRWFFAGKKMREADTKAKDLVSSATKEAENLRKEVELQGKDMMIKLRQEFETETKSRREEQGVAERRVSQKEQNIEKRVEVLENKEKDIVGRLENVQVKEKNIEEQNNNIEGVLKD